MIQASELRIGNFVNHAGSITQIHELKINYCTTNIYTDIEYSKIEPIELTEEWLVKFSFEKYDWQDAYFIKACKKHLFIQFFKGEILTFFTKVTRDSGGHKTNGREKFNIGYQLKYVHQIQNLYFALTGQELTIKD